jgi:hypothetical protein
MFWSFYLIFIFHIFPFFVLHILFFKLLGNREEKIFCTEG